MNLPELSFEQVVKYNNGVSFEKAYKFFAEPGYIHNIRAKWSKPADEKDKENEEECIVTCNCHHSMKKNDPPHQIKAIFPNQEDILGSCTCAAGSSGKCHHFVALLLLLAHHKHLGLAVMPDEVACTSLPQRWHIPRPKKVVAVPAVSLEIKKMCPGTDFTNSMRSKLYSPIGDFSYPQFSSSFIKSMKKLDPVPQFVSVFNGAEERMVKTDFGDVPVGSVLSYQLQSNAALDINIELPLENSIARIQNNFCGPLLSEHQQAFEAIQMSLEQCRKTERMTRKQSEESLWYELRKNRITASKLSLVARRKSGYDKLAQQLLSSKKIQTAHMKRGLQMEPVAADFYSFMKNSMCQIPVQLSTSGMIINPKCPWLAASPDRVVLEYRENMQEVGLLEVKVPKENTILSELPYLKLDKNNDLFLIHTHAYYYQMQCQLALSGLNWCDFLVYINDDNVHLERILFDNHFFEEAKDIVDSFYFSYFIHHASR